MTRRVNARLGIKAFGWEPGRSVYVNIEELETLAASPLPDPKETT